MKWSLFYSLREGLDGFRRAKLASFIALVSISFSLILIGVLTVVTINLWALVEAVRNRIEFEVFVDNALDESGIAELRRELTQVEGVAEARFISKAEAAEIFKREFALSAGQDSKSFLEVLESNPLPASFRISLQKSHQNSVSAQRVASEIEKLHGVDEVVYRRDLVVTLDRYVRLVLLAGGIVGLVFCLGSLLLVINDIRLVTYAKRRLIETMQLVGATRAFVRRPLLVQGFLQGMLGGIFASGSLYLAYRLLSLELGAALRLPPIFFPGIVAAGILLGLTASYLGARKYIR
ncbi:MAG: ABC transporter permease [candidate division KSB1 bacterium]|nr:ABC transporter permease [candidate division KSB1 bacterium]MDZ7304079.1 ABC transporter permease [candidate division KSB1 bacterium]MDZ7312059.1 ABC transporter permease [candidate division KSB1 bacterium]